MSKVYQLGVDVREVDPGTGYYITVREVFVIGEFRTVREAVEFFNKMKQSQPGPLEERKKEQS